MASAGPGRCLHPRFFSNRLRFCPAARINASQLTNSSLRKRSRCIPCQSVPSAKGFLVGLGWLIGTHSIQILLIHTAAQTASLLIGGTLGFEWTRITVPYIRPVAALSVSRLPLYKVEFFACGTDVDISRHLITEAVWAKEC